MTSPGPSRRSVLRAAGVDVIAAVAAARAARRTTSPSTLQSGGALPGVTPGDVTDEQARARNPHVQWFDAATYGYATLDLTPAQAVWTVWGVSRETDTGAERATAVRRFRVPAGSNQLQQVETS